MSSEVPFQGKTPLSNAAWQNSPRVPRAIALLTFLSEQQDAATEMEPELGAALLVDVYHLNDEFLRWYGIPINLADDLLTSAQRYCIRVPQPPANGVDDSIEIALATRTLYRLGYADGANGCDFVKDSDTNDHSGEGVENERHPHRRILEDLSPNYGAGHEFGLAEHYLRAFAEDVRLALDAKARSLLSSRLGDEAVMSEIERAFDEVAVEAGLSVPLPSPEEIYEEARGNEVDGLLVAVSEYTRAKRQQVIRLHARGALLLRAYGAYPPVLRTSIDIAQAAREVQAELASGDPASCRFLEAQKEEAKLLLAAFGVSAMQWSEILAGSRDVSEILRNNVLLDDMSVGAVAYTELSRGFGSLWSNALSFGPAIGTAPEDEDGTPISCGLSACASEEVLALGAHLRNGTFPQRADEDAKQVFMALGRMARTLEAECTSDLDFGSGSGTFFVASLAAYRAAQAMDLDAPLADRAAALLVYEAQLEAREQAENGTEDFWTVFDHELVDITAGAIANRIVSELREAGGEMRLRAEMEMTWVALNQLLSPGQYGLDRERVMEIVRASLSWASLYRREAASLLGQTSEPRSQDDVVEIAVLFARARLIEMVIDERLDEIVRTRLADSSVGGEDEVLPMTSEEAWDRARRAVRHSAERLDDEFGARLASEPVLEGRFRRVLAQHLFDYLVTTREDLADIDAIDRAIAMGEDPVDALSGTGPRIANTRARRTLL